MRDRNHGLTLLILAAVTALPAASARGAGYAPISFGACNFLNFYLTGPSYAGCDNPAFEAIDEAYCEDLVSTSTGGPQFGWIVFTTREDFPALENGVGWLRFGLEHEFENAYEWHLCTGGSETPEALWPESGTGNWVYWPDECYRPAGGTARVGFVLFYDEAYGSYVLGADPRIGDATFTDCDGFEDGMLTTHRSAFSWGDISEPSVVCQSYGDPHGEPLCVGAVPTRTSSWGSVKNLYR